MTNTFAPRPPIVLVAIDDEQANLQFIEIALQQDGLEIFTATDPSAGLGLIKQHRAQIVLVDLKMPQMSGMEVLERALEINPDVSVVLITGHYSTESAVEAIQKGACDYLEKPVAVEALRARVERLVEDSRNRQQHLQLENELTRASQFEGIVGWSPAMMEVFDRVRRVGPHFRNVLVTGATGTGKELVARALHRLSPAAAGPMVVCNSSAIVETLFESELFGHVKGAFTGASQDRIGVFEFANNGTVFLDEIGDLPQATQAKLLRVLQNQEVQRVGSPVARKVNVRVIAATNRDLKRMVAEKQFREDLYYRLAAVEVHLPRLAERKEDLPLLIRHLIEKFSKEYGKAIRGPSRGAENMLAAYGWPGNVRELENVLSHACMMCEGETIDVRDLPDAVKQRRHAASVEDYELLPLEEVDRRHILRVLESVGGNKIRATEILGIGRTTLYRFLQQQEEKPDPGMESAPEQKVR
ncbi:MAG: sigma-54 dependent transcriptional regulator [Acidobacteria bacterium]|nr:sigma-54 dependent transcriptional regulator [Acidobacteriota bacterium]MCL5288848.1 sigma-54 dependent transcriptional regulator [Acidobacteriota bacterium]